MRSNTRFSTAVHALLIVAAGSPYIKITSGWIAESVGCNPVEIRKIFGGLKSAGILSVTHGRGGAALCRPPADITLLDIYTAVVAAPLDELIGVHLNTSEECGVGRNVQALLRGPYREIGQAVEEKMASITLARLLEDLYRLEPELPAAFAAMADE